MLHEAATRTARLAEGIRAVAPGLLWMEQTRTIVAADAHLAYEDVIGGALPTWSTTDAIAILLAAARTLDAREVLFLGDVIHGTRMSEGAARDVQAGLDRLRAFVAVTLVAGNHEGRSRGADVLGETVEFAHRAGWLLIHGDQSPLLAEPQNNCHGEPVEPRPSLSRAGLIIGHLHPSIRSNGTSAPAFLAGGGVIVVPALTPYSEGLDVCGDDCFEALQPLGVRARGDLQVIAATSDLMYPLGTLAGLRQELRRPINESVGPTRYGYRRKFLRPDR